MYVPKQFREERRDVLLDTIRTLQFASVVIKKEGEFLATHVPVLVRDGASTVIEFHVSRANPLWKFAVDACPALVIIQGPQAYIHPGWFETKKQTGKAVPTWNYVAIHAQGPLQIVDDTSWLLRHLADLTRANEAGRSDSWAITDAPADYIEAMVRGIIGLELTVDRLDGAWKMIQHHPEQNRKGVIEALSASDNAGDREVAQVMRALKPL
jgi:transcriptional regulator